MVAGRGDLMSIPAVNITHIVINDHGPIFAELIDLLVDALGRLGHQVGVTTNRLLADRLNILIGHTAFLQPRDYAVIESSGAPYIVFQVEALDEAVGVAPQYPAYIEFLTTARQIWDYSPTNFPFLARRACQAVRHVPLGYAARLERVAPAAENDIDVLFCGVISPRRQHVLAALHERGVRVRALFGAYGSARDREIARAKVVLNVHQFDTPHLEEVRLAYLLNNRCFVVSETSDRDPYGGGVVFSDYAGLVDCCGSFLGPGMGPERDRIAQAGYVALKRTPTVESIRSAVAGSGAGGAVGG
jgi:hypothetical protein